MLFRTDGTAETYGGIGAYPFVWTYNGSSSGSRIMILDTDGRLWTDRYGWLDTAFDAAGAADAINTRIDEDVLPAIPTNNNQLTNGAGYITSADGGNAATLEGRRANDFLKANDTPLSNTDLDTLYDDDSTLYYSNSEYDSNTNIPFQNYFTLLNFRNPYLDNTGDPANANDRASQLWLGDTPNKFYVRYRQGGAGWHPWERVWTDNSFSDTNVSNWNTAYGWGDHAGLYDAVGASAIVNDRIETEIIPSITTAQSAANDAQAAADLAVATADTAEARANSAREDAAAAQATADSKLGATAKAADSEAVDGVDSSRIVYGANARRSTRYDGVGMVSTNQNSGFYYGNNPDGNPYNEWWNWLTVAGASWTSGNNYDFKIAHDFHSDAMYVSRMANGTQFGWRKVWDSGNLDPANASNLSSGTVSYAVTNKVLPTSGNYVWNAATTAGNYDTGVQTSFVRSADGWPSYGAVLHVGARGGGDAGGDFQLYCGHGSSSGGNHLRFRNADNSASPTDSWTDWKTILDSSNFASYAESAGRIDNEILPQVTTNATNIGRNATDIATKAAAGGSYGQDFTANDMRVDQWFRNTASGKGLYNEATTQHFYSDDDDYWNIAGGSGANGLRFRDEHAGTIRGYVYANNGNDIGFLDAGGSWAVRHRNDEGTYFYTDGGTMEFRVGRDVVTGQYGTVQTESTRNGWSGYSIQGNYVFMSSGTGGCGIYNDVDNEWMAYFNRNSGTELHHNGSSKLVTTSAGVTVTGTMTATAFSGSLDWANVTNKPTIPEATAPIQALVEGGNESTLASITFSEGEGAATFTLADGQTFRLAFSR
jgi:hypothetical protein